MQTNSGQEINQSTDRSERYRDTSDDCPSKTTRLSSRDFVEQQASLLRRFEEAKFARVQNNQDDCNAKASTDVDKQNETNAEDDFNNPELVREQHRIYEEIQRRVSTRAGRKPSPENRRTIQEEKLRAATQDQVVDLGKGKKLRIKGNRHVYKSIERGTAKLVNCPSCRAVLQVDRSTKALYCVYCHQISPIDLADSTPVSSESNLSPAYSEHIAQSVQQQEIDAACSRKMSKSSGNN